MAETPDRSLKLELEQRDSATIMKVVGAVSIGDSDALQGELLKLTDQKIGTIILDLSEMNFICSSGLGAIILAHLKARHHQGQIVLVDPQPAVRELLDTTRLSELFPICSSVDEAMES